MTDEDKELVKRLREKADWLDPEIDMIEEWEALDAADRIEALSAENERLREALENIGNLSLNGCVKVNTPHGLWVGTPDAYAREVLGMPWRTEDPDYSNEVVGGWND